MSSSVSRLSRISASSSTTRMRPAVVAGERLPLVESGIHWFSGQGELQMEQCPSAGLASHFDRATMLLNDAVGDGQAETGALARDLSGEERVVDAREMIG